MVMVRFSYRGDSHELDNCESAWRVAPVQASLPGLARWFELRSAKSERRYFARHRLVARHRALQAGDAVLGSLKLPALHHRPQQPVVALAARLMRVNA